jgi:hypothetical protein
VSYGFLIRHIKMSHSDIVCALSFFVMELVRRLCNYKIFLRKVVLCVWYYDDAYDDSFATSSQRPPAWTYW